MNFSSHLPKDANNRCSFLHVLLYTGKRKKRNVHLIFKFMLRIIDVTEIAMKTLKTKDNK